MRRLLWGLLFLPLMALAGEGKKSMDFTFAPLRDLVSLYFAEIEKVPYTLCDALLRDDKAVSFRTAVSADRSVLVSALRSNGYDLWDESGVVVVCKPELRKVLMASPFVYRVKYRSVDVLVDELQVLVSGKFAKSSKDSKDSSADLLVFSGSAADVAVLRQVLPLLDVPVRDVLVRATIYEVGDSATVESAINAVGSILGGRVSVDLGVTPSGPVGRISVGGLDAVVGLLDKDSRFRLVSRPVVRVSSGGKSVLSVGSEVPVSGGAVTTSQGQVTQNVVYRPAGVILTVSPTVRQDVISVDVVQVLSDFVRTDTGLNYTPTLNKRELTSSFSVRSGEVTLLAGLTSSRQSGSDQSLLGFSLGKGSSASGSQLLLLLQVELI